VGYKNLDFLFIHDNNNSIRNPRCLLIIFLPYQERGEIKTLPQQYTPTDSSLNSCFYFQISQHSLCSQSELPQPPLTA
jgi:hypothetical protein